MTLSLITLLLTCMVASQVEARPSRHNASHKTGKAAYFITNDGANAIVAMHIGCDGTLSAGTNTPTGGQGAVAIDGSTNTSAATDGLVSQSSLSRAGRHLFAVNAGSNTVSMSSIHAADPTKLTLVGTPAAIPGEFVNTVAASAKHNLVCAGATGAVAGISCARFDPHLGIGKMDQLRTFDIKQSTPPVGPTNTLSQVFWSEDERKLFATIKGDPAKNNTGFLSSFPIEQSSLGGCGTLSAKETRSSPQGTAVLFGSLPIPKTSDIFATDASFGAAILSVGSNGTASLSSSQPINGQKATCWVTISPATNTAFVTDVGVPRLVEMSVKDATIMGQMDLSSTGITGMIDLKASGNFVYALAPGEMTRIVVLDVGKGSNKGQLVQAFDVGKLGAGTNSQGMVISE